MKPKQYAGLAIHFLEKMNKTNFLMTPPWKDSIHKTYDDIKYQRNDKGGNPS